MKAEDRAVLLDHNYDGIRELDYPLPRWWLMTFYITIIFGVVYAAYYMLGPGPTLRDEMKVSLDEIYAKRPKEEPVVIDEKALEEKTAVDHVKLGEKVFASRCMPCHGAHGEGGIGPNLTDDFWLHGDGGANAIAKVVRDGVTEKGMPAWGEVLQPDEVKDVVIFVRSIHGTNPANAKAPQGAKQGKS